MSCWLCGHEKDNAHHLGCARIAHPDLTESQAARAGLIAAPRGKEPAIKDKTEVLKEGSMTTVPQGPEGNEDDDEDFPPAEGGETVEQCEYDDCDNPKKSNHPRAKYCVTHSDPKNRKE